MRLIPRDESFFALFDRLADRLVAASRLLHQLFSEPSRLVHFAGAIKDVEHEADEFTHEVIVRLDRSFVTPLDREDIHSLATSLDNVIDLIDGTARRATVFDIRDRSDGAIGLAALIERAAAQLQLAVKDVRNRKVVSERVREVKEIEEAGDQLYAGALSALFSGAPDPIHVIKWKELLDTLEHALDEADDVANVLESIAFKHS